MAHALGKTLCFLGRRAQAESGLSIKKSGAGPLQAVACGGAAAGLGGTGAVLPNWLGDKN